MKQQLLAALFGLLIAASCTDYGFAPGVDAASLGCSFKVTTEATAGQGRVHLDVTNRSDQLCVCGGRIEYSYGSLGGPPQNGFVDKAQTVANVRASRRESYVHPGTASYVTAGRNYVQCVLRPPIIIPPPPPPEKYPSVRMPCAAPCVPERNESETQDTMWMKICQGEKNPCNGQPEEQLTTILESQNKLIFVDHDEQGGDGDRYFKYCVDNFDSAVFASIYGRDQPGKVGKGFFRTAPVRGYCVYLGKVRQVFLHNTEQNYAVGKVISCAPRTNTVPNDCQTPAPWNASVTQSDNEQ